MSLIKVVIIDDEPAAVDVISELTFQLAPDLDVAGVAVNGIEAVNVIIKEKPDLIFLDVDMPLMNGLQVIDKLPAKNFEIIFTTGSADHALKAIKLQALDYLLKPIDPADFQIAVEKARQVINSKRNSKPENISLKIQFPTHKGIIYLEESEIIHILGMGSYSQVILYQKNEKYTVSKSIGQMQVKLSDNFFRCHNSHLINLSLIKSFSSKDGYFVIMKDDSKIEVSRRSKDDLLKKLADNSI